MAELLEIENPLPPRPEGHYFATRWPVRVADIGATATVKLEAVGRYMQDVGFDHLHATNTYEDHPYWIVMRSVVDVIKPITLPDQLNFERWGYGLSTRWCEMRMQIQSDGGGLIETLTFGMNVSGETFGPARLSDTFIKTVTSNGCTDRLRWRAALSPAMPDLAEEGVERHAFALRVADLDHMGHINNAAYWQGVEQVLGTPEVFRPYRAIIEYAKPVMADDEVFIRVQRTSTKTFLWFEVDGVAKTTASIQDL